MSTEVPTMEKDPRYYVGPRVKEMKDLTKVEKKDATFLKHLSDEYADIKHLDSYGDKLQKIMILISNLELQNKEMSEEASVEEKFEYASKLLPGLKKHYDAQKTATREVFLVVDAENHLGALIKQARSVKETIRHYLGMSIKANNQPMVTPKELGELSDIWFDYEEAVDFETFGGFSPDKWCLGRCLYRPSETTGPFPTWQNYLGRMSDPAGFAAWIYGVASKRYKGRQVMWVYGPNGEDGKTYIQKLIAANLFPNVSAPMVNSALQSDAARFMGAEFEGKTLAYWDDCNNQKALFTEAVKQLSAGDQGNVSRIEGKGAAVYQGQLETRLWINSNFTPIISQDNYITSRLLFITLDKLHDEVNPNIGEQFKAEMPYFLNWAKKMYEKFCPDNYRIIQPDHVLEEIMDLGTDFEQAFVDVYDSWLEPTDDPSQYITAKGCSDILKNVGIIDNLKVKDFYTWLEKRHGGRRRGVKKDGKNVSMVVGIKRQDGAVERFLVENPKKGGFKY